MTSSTLRINIISDSDEASYSLSALNKIQSNNDIEFEVVYGNIELEADLYLLNLSKADSELANAIRGHKNGACKKSFVCINKNDAMLVSSIVKSGFDKIYILPGESYRMSLELEEKLTQLYRDKLRPPGSTESAFDQVLGDSEYIHKIKDVSRRIADNNDINILLLGETGTGKGLIAKAIHDYANKKAPFVDIVCTAIPAQLLESELFGYEKGAFTDARVSKNGLFELANKGTILLDEIGDLDIGLQAKLLRVIEKKVFRRLGSTKDIEISARIISATNQNLEDLVEKNRFRRDLFHRLNVISIEIPPLRKRKEDIYILTESFVREFNNKFKKNIKYVDDSVWQYLLNYEWPGNVRELRHAVEKAVILEDSEVLTLKFFTGITKNKNNGKTVFPSIRIPSNDGNFVYLNLDFKNLSLDDVSKTYAKEVLNKMKGNKSETARLLNVSRPKLNKLVD